MTAKPVQAVTDDLIAGLEASVNGAEYSELTADISNSELGLLLYERATLKHDLQVSREETQGALRYLADIREVIGKNGQLRTPELIDNVRELARDARRMDKLASQCTLWYGRHESALWSMPSDHFKSRREQCDPGDLRAMIDTL